MEKVFEIQRIKQEKRNLPVRFLKDYQEGKITIRSPKDVSKLAINIIGDEDREVFLVIGLNIKNEVVAVHRCHIGSLNASIVSPREVFKMAILNNCGAIIVAHNHPSFSCSPSQEDLDVTKRLVECGSIMGIDLLDHLIVNENSFVSLKEKGYI